MFTSLLAATATAGVPATPGEVVAAAPAAAWRDIPVADLIEMTLSDGRVVTLQLAPALAPAHVANIRRLAAARWWDGLAIVRVQENYVVQWGDPEEPGRAPKPLPPGMQATSERDYDRPLAGLRLTPLATRDAYAARVGFADGWPVASDGRRAWLPHCYAYLGVGRNLSPDAGSGAELYVVNGTPPRALDRNIAVVGRVIGGMEHLSVLPRGTGPLGFYARPEMRVPIVSIVPGSGRRWQQFDTASPTFARYAHLRMNRRDSFFIRPAGGADLCNVPVPVRPAP